MYAWRLFCHEISIRRKFRRLVKSWLVTNVSLFNSTSMLVRAHQQLKDTKFACLTRSFPYHLQMLIKIVPTLEVLLPLPS